MTFFQLLESIRQIGYFNPDDDMQPHIFADKHEESGITNQDLVTYLKPSLDYLIKQLEDGERYEGEDDLFDGEYFWDSLKTSIQQNNIYAIVADLSAISNRIKYHVYPNEQQIRNLIDKIINFILHPRLDAFHNTNKTNIALITRQELEEYLDDGYANFSDDFANRILEIVVNDGIPGLITRFNTSQNKKRWAFAIAYHSLHSKNPKQNLENLLQNQEVSQILSQKLISKIEAFLRTNP